MVTSEPSGTMAWMPLNDQTSRQADLRHPHDGQLRPGGRARRQPRRDRQRPPGLHGRQRAGRELPDGRLAHVQLALGRADRLLPGREQHRPLRRVERLATARRRPLLRVPGLRTSPPPARRSNKAIMDQQEDITHFQEQFNGPFPFNANGIIVACPRASFEEEMQTKIVFVGGRSASTRRPSRTRTCTSGGATTSPTPSRLHVLQGGLRRHVGGLHIADIAADAAGRRARTPYKAAFEASIVNRFNATLQLAPRRHDVLERRAVEPDLGEPVRQPRTPTPGRARPTSRCGRSSARTTSTTRRTEIQHDYGGGSIIAPQRDRDLPQVHAEPVARLLEQARRVLQAVVGHGLHRLRRRPATSRRSPAPAWPAAASMTPTAAARTTASTPPARPAAPCRRRCR